MAVDEQPAALSEVLVKDMVGVHRDCPIKWRADFARMEIDIRVDFIAPSALISFLEGLPRYDERFLKTNITGAVRICNRFKVALWVAYGDTEIRYRLTARQPEMEIGGRAGPEIDLTAGENDREGLI